MEFIQTLDWQTLLICAAITTLLVSAINTLNLKVSSNVLVFVVALVITLLNTTFISGASFSDWQRILSSLLFTMAFAVLFYNYAGQWFIDKLFNWLKDRVSEKLPVRDK